jgi:hypothetical protein
MVIMPAFDAGSAGWMLNENAGNVADMEQKLLPADSSWR